MDLTQALIIFVDVRGFTNWSESIGVFAHVDKFVTDFGDALKAEFQGYYYKGLGDGAMLIKALDDQESDDPIALIASVLEKVRIAEDKFGNICKAFAKKAGHRTDLQLGWGIVRGAAKKLSDGDYVGADVNKCARICDMARPFGIVVDSDDFADMPKGTQWEFYQRVVKAKGVVNDINVWLTKEAASKFLGREKVRETPEVHVAGVCMKDLDEQDPMILIARRVPGRSLHAKVYEGCGGQLARSEFFDEGVARHFRLEMNMEVNVHKDLHVFYEILQANEPKIPGIRFLCEPVDPDLTPTSANHSEIVWKRMSQIRKMRSEDFVPGFQKDVESLIKQFKAKQQPTP